MGLQKLLQHAYLLHQPYAAVVFFSYPLLPHELTLERQLLPSSTTSFARRNIHWDRWMECKNLKTTVLQVFVHRDLFELYYDQMIRLIYEAK
ncbi:unnamed protein product [Allacma fusca]|uniref:Uncharacterized protein n=1 Tax=Allacma fusca TaxID=39272 RepID=A0A8J2KKC4_9HEXA|nr:unnamed protein product [Allacma fusca]